MSPQNSSPLGTEARNRQFAYSHVCEKLSKAEIKLLRVDQIRHFSY